VIIKDSINTIVNALSQVGKNMGKSTSHWCHKKTILTVKKNSSLLLRILAALLFPRIPNIKLFSFNYYLFKWDCSRGTWLHVIENGPVEMPCPKQWQKEYCL